MPDEAFCSPRSTAVEIPRSPGVSIFPSYVVMHRCTGSCPSTQDTRHCTVTHRDAIDVLIVEVTSSDYTLQDMKIYNHTACSCDCIKQASECDAQKETWNAGICSCDCIQDGSQCDSLTQRWNANNCECECAIAAQICDDPTKEWDTEICGCHCRKSLQDHCTAQNQPIDTVTCNCIADVNAL